MFVSLYLNEGDAQNNGMVFFQDLVSVLILLLAFSSFAHAHEDHDTTMHDSAHDKE